MKTDIDVWGWVKEAICSIKQYYTILLRPTILTPRIMWSHNEPCFGVWLPLPSTLVNGAWSFNVPYGSLWSYGVDIGVGQSAWWNSRNKENDRHNRYHVYIYIYIYIYHIYIYIYLQNNISQLKSIEHDGIFSPWLEVPNCACVAFESDQPMVARTQRNQRNQWNSLTLDRSRPHIAHFVSYNFWQLLSP